MVSWNGHLGPYTTDVRKIVYLMMIQLIQLNAFKCFSMSCLISQYRLAYPSPLLYIWCIYIKGMQSKCWVSVFVLLQSEGNYLQRELFLSEVNNRDNSSGYWGLLFPKRIEKFPLLCPKMLQHANKSPDLHWVHMMQLFIFVSASQGFLMLTAVKFIWGNSTRLL